MDVIIAIGICAVIFCLLVCISACKVSGRISEQERKEHGEDFC